ncbi:hypothetical protein [Nigerium massiliense]|uniref:hypothetical protein n=1 Tax=Nigerium massiliense TaxID=1522317 RepID=UPI00058D9368|nr:hypothetical protein [Nigerium massiliense]
MSSYRVEIEILGLKPGHRPPEVMDAAVAAIGLANTVESRDLDIAAGTPRILIRFAVSPASRDEEDEDARGAAFDGCRGVEEVATIGRSWLLRRDGGRWTPVRF